MLDILTVVVAGGFIAVLIRILIIALVIGLILWLIQAVPIPEPFHKIVYYLALIIGVILIILQLLSLL